MPGMLEDKVCVVTGSGQGMGRASALEMAREGGRVVVTDINAINGAETVEMIKSMGGEAIFIGCDLRKSDQITALMVATAAHFGGIDVLHNNAAIHETELTDKTSIEELDETIWDLVVDINLKALWLTTKAAVPYLKKSGKGAIVNVASTGSVVAYAMAGAYCATKGGVVMLTKAAAVDLAKFGIRCNCYCPASIETPMLAKYIEVADDPGAMIRTLSGAHLTPRLGRPEEIAKLACFLASDNASFINGASYLIDGGALAWRGLNG